MSESYAFGEFVLERSQQRVVRRDGAALSLPPRLFDALLLFVERPGALLDKEMLIAALWPGLVVEENNLSQVISGLRRALGDDPQDSRFIQTVPRRGFRFVAPVTVLPDLDARPPEPHPVPPEPARAARTAPGPARRRWLGAALAAGAAVSASGLVGLWWWHERRPARAGTNPSDTTIAVLPFKPLHAAERDELLEVGMADSLITRLSTVPGVVVRSSGAVLRYAGPQQDPLLAARDLDVAWIVDGSLQRRGNQLRATARLLRTADGTAAWSGSFDERFADVFDVQDQISTRVVQALAPALLTQSSANLHLTEIGGTRSVEAYQLYLAASWRVQDMRSESNARAIALLQQALEIDPSYALAWARLAWAHRRRLFREDVEPVVVFEAANAALMRALALAPELAQARAGLGYSRYWYDFDWPGAEREFNRALAASPNEESAHLGLALLQLTQGRYDDGFLHMRLARELDPMSPVMNALEASLLLDRGLLAEARVRVNRALDIAPQHGLAHSALGLVLMAEGQPERGIAALRRAVEFTDGSTRPQAVLAQHLVARGGVEEARAILSRLLDQARARYVPPTTLAIVHAALGDAPSALVALELAYAKRDQRLTFLKDDPSWVPLRREPRFVALVKKLKLDGFGPGLTPV